MDRQRSKSDENKKHNPGQASENLVPVSPWLTYFLSIPTPTPISSPIPSERAELGPAARGDVGAEAWLRAHADRMRVPPGGVEVVQGRQLSQSHHGEGCLPPTSGGISSWR